MHLIYAFCTKNAKREQFKKLLTNNKFPGAYLVTTIDDGKRKLKKGRG
jgi:hypothetical protein